MVIGVYNAVITFLAAQDLDGTVGDNLIGIHVQRSSCTSLNRIYDKVLMELSLQDLITGFYDRIGDLFVKKTYLTVGDSCCFFDISQAVDDLRMHAKTGDMKVLSST